MSGVVTIGEVPFSKENMIAKLEEFSSLYDKRPVKNNKGGMLSPHMFLAWFALQTLKPKAIIESGVWLGQGTWFFERACPDAQLYCIDFDLDRIQYRSARAEYFDHDFSIIDWSSLPKDDTVLFFDDHQNACERLKTAKWFGFKHLIFEDNYPPLHGDCYSLKKVFANSGFTPLDSRSIRVRLKRMARAIVGLPELNPQPIPANCVDAKNIEQKLEVYYEFPPVFKAERTRWGDLWDDENYPTPEPLLHSVEKAYQRRFMDEAAYYTWMCYARLK